VRACVRARNYSREWRGVKGPFDTAPVWAGGVEADGRVGGGAEGLRAGL